MPDVSFLFISISRTARSSNSELVRRTTRRAVMLWAVGSRYRDPLGRSAVGQSAGGRVALDSIVKVSFGDRRDRHRTATRASDRFHGTFTRPHIWLALRWTRH